MWYQIPELQGRKYLKSSFTTLNFPLFISSGCLSPSLFSNFFLTLRMNWGNCFIIHVENINLFLLIHFILGK